MRENQYLKILVRNILLLLCLISGVLLLPYSIWAGGIAVSEDKTVVAEDKTTASENKTAAPEDKTTAAEDKTTASGGDKVIRVAYFALGDYYREETDGSIKSYDTVFLDRLMEYTDFTYKYVYCDTWEQALSMLENHEIDIVGTAQWNDRREEQYEYCLESYGYTVGEMAALEESNFVYEDYEAIGNAVIGCTENYVRMDEMKEVFSKQNINPEIKTYANQQLLEKALLDGEIDIIAANSHAMRQEWKVIEKFSYSPFYFISWKGNTQLTDMIDEAIIQMNLYDSNFSDELLQEYFPILVGSPFTREEYDLIDEKKEYIIYFDGETKPLAWFDEESNSMKGILVDVCDQLREKTGLNLVVKKRTEGTDDSADQVVNYRTLYYDPLTELGRKDGVTDTILDERFNLYHRVGDAYSATGAYTIAIVKNRDGLRDYLSEKYPNCTLVEYDTPAECLEHMQSRDTSLAYLNSHVADNIIIGQTLMGITEIPTDEVTFGIGLQFHGENRELLADIIDKGMKLIDTDSVNEAMLQYALKTYPSVNLSYLIKNHTNLTVTVAALVVVILIILTALYTYARVMRRERDRIERLDQERTDFFARMSHDMRTPMNGILGMIELTEESEDLSEIKENMGKAKISGKYMLSLINDTLDLQRLESGKLKFNMQIVKAGDVLENVLVMVRASAKQKDIKILADKTDMDTEAYVRLDPVRVKQIFVNLLSNAIKFTPEGGTIEIKVKCLRKNAYRVSYRIEIHDSGVGMSREFIDKQLYKAYSQERNIMSNQYAGSGLGLAITKNLVNRMGGRIEVQSELGEGTTFIVYLDFERVKDEKAVQDIQEKVQHASRVQAELKGCRILLCEDHPLNAEIAKRLLERVGCEVTWMPDGKMGVEEFEASKENYYDTILMDIRMPVMNGLEATRAIRRLDRADAKTVPILAMTANAYDSDIKQSKEAGMNEHLAKPIEPQELYNAILRNISGTSKTERK